MWFSRFRQAFLALLLPWLFVFLIQMLGRAYLFYTNKTPGLLTDFSHDVIRMFWIGGLFDVRVACLIFVPFLLVAASFSVDRRGFIIWQHFWPWMAAVLSLIVTAITVGNVFYYVTYGRFIDVFVFGLVDDDTTAVLKTVWKEYPVIWVLLFLILFFSIVLKIYLRWQYYLSHKKGGTLRLSVSIINTLLVILACVVGMRGSVGTFPLRQSDAQVSEVKMLNMLTPNGVIALNWAFNAYAESGNFSAATDEEGSKLLSQFLGGSSAPGLRSFMTQTDANPYVKKNPPNVVLSVMESMGYHLASFDNQERDLLGALRKHWLADWRFDRFISEGDGTIDTLSRLFIRSPMSSIGQTSAQNVNFASNMFKPFLANGYKIIFVTSGNGAWHNLNQFLPHLGVSEFIEQNGLKKRYPEAEIGTWGVPDEYMFRYMTERLKEAEKKGEHVFIMSMSTTHHPPYKTPKGHEKKHIDLTVQEKLRLRKLAADEELNEVMSTLYYSNDQLGRFISWVKSETLGSHTIVAVTGDHNIRGIGYPEPQELALGHAVPFYIYVPLNYQHSSYFDGNRVGSHKDILPTLYQLSLSDTLYYRTGCNLLAQHLDGTWCNGYNPEITITNEGACIFTGKPEFRPWKNKSGLLLASPERMDLIKGKECHRWEAFTGLLWWQLNRQVHGGK